MDHPNVMNAPKTTTFQMRINPEIKNQAEQLFQNCGMTLTDAINVFIQQSMNVGGLPFIVTQNSREALTMHDSGFFIFTRRPQRLLIYK